MTIYNFGSIVLDNFYRMPRIPVPGESVRANDVNFGLGGKGANQSIAARKAGSDVVHIGAIGFDGEHILCLLYTSPSPRDGLLSRMPSSA